MQTHGVAVFVKARVTAWHVPQNTRYRHKPTLLSSTLRLILKSWTYLPFGAGIGTSLRQAGSEKGIVHDYKRVSNRPAYTSEHKST